MTPNQFLIPQPPLAAPPVEPPTLRLRLDRTPRRAARRELCSGRASAVQPS
ncbi:hypothetical protein [Streptosporangium sp. NPDC004631]